MRKKYYDGESSSTVEAHYIRQGTDNGLVFFGRVEGSIKNLKSKIDEYVRY